MNLDGYHFIGGKRSRLSKSTFFAINPSTEQKLEPSFAEATAEEINEAVSLAERGFEKYKSQPAEKIAAFLERIAEEIINLGDVLIERAGAETALPQARLIGERARTVGQIKMFAELVREGSWLEATIDRAIPDRKPLPKPDARRMLIPIGPVAVFGASNFPLAFSVAGGDTISALAAGNSVVVKAHPAHPGTSELVARAIQNALTFSGLPLEIFSMVHGTSHEVGLQLVKHPLIKAVGFTGSLKGGRALFDAANTRPEPIPVYAEMGSTNPVFILPGALQKNESAIAQGLVQSVTMGVGQFCTNPGLVFGLKSETLSSFIDQTAQLAAAVPAGTMLHSGICQRFREGLRDAAKVSGVRIVTKNESSSVENKAPATVFTTDAETFQKNKSLSEENFGPSTLIVSCGSEADLEKIAREMPGQLTATIHGTEADLVQHANLISILQQKVGRLVFNSFPTGVEVCASMHHGGPYPATTDSRSTSVGSYAIKRFARPICFQGFPDAVLPSELKNKNVRIIWRLLDNQWTKNDA